MRMGTDDRKKDPAAVALGRKGGQASASNLTEKERKARAQKAIEARWEKYRAEHGLPPKAAKKAAVKRAKKVT
jgi:hypothetical protein